MSRPPGLTARILFAQLVVILVGGATLILTAVLVAPPLFAEHLSSTGESSPEVIDHAQQAFESSFTISLLVAVLAAAIAAGFLAWLLTRRVTRPIEALAHAAEAVATGDYEIQVPTSTFGAELTALSASFQRMALRLADTDAARNRLLADLAHEIRTPLATLEAYIDGLEDDVVPADPETYATMRGQVTRLRRLSGDIKEAAAASEHALHLNRSLTDINSTVALAVAAAAPRYQTQSVALVLDDALPAPTMLHVDPDRIQQVLANLLDNALRHTPSGGTVVVRETALADDVTISVADDGEGIPVDRLDAIFDRFHRVDPARSSSTTAGSGLGLTIARAIVQDHGGTITAASRGPGTGSTFTITLLRTAHGSTVP